MRTVAILGPTASGKTSLSIKLAKKFNANILSLDSLSIYKEIDIASAKPTSNEREGIRHFGIDEIYPDVNFNVSIFFDIYNKAKKYSEKDGKDLIIVGGTGFYLKSLLTGLSQKPNITQETKQKVAIALRDINDAFKFIQKKDQTYAQKISNSDSYRIEKWFEIYLQSGLGASEYFKLYKQEPLIKNMEIFEIEMQKDILKQRINLRTEEMIRNGLIDEVVYLEKTYTRAPNSMRSIGIKETLRFLDGFIGLDGLKEEISLNTAKLAKRQRTFNSTQFAPHVKGDIKYIFDMLAIPN